MNLEESKKCEQEIKEMAKLINDIDIPYNFGNLRLTMNGSEFLANQLFIKGYRKQSEVVKEIVERLRKEDAYFDDYHYDQLLDDIELDYGVQDV